MNHTNVMIDLETLGTKPGSIILSIGAVAFAEGEPEESWTRFDSGPISIVSSRACDLTMDDDTLLWWLEQDLAAKSLLRKCLGREAAALDVVLCRFADWLTNTPGDTPVIWGNVANFDNVLLRSAWMAALPAFTLPWKYCNDQCYRTMKNVFSQVPRPPFVGVKHDALADAFHQTRHLQAILKYIKESTHVG